MIRKTERQTRSWKEWWDLLNRTPCSEVFRGHLSGSLPKDRKWYASITSLFNRSVDPSSILKETGLSEEVRKSILQIARSAGSSRRVQTDYLREFLQSLRLVLKISPEQQLADLPVELADRLSVAVPLRALDRLRAPGLSLVHTLPLELSKLIESVVRATRLWKREKVDVARELLNHCEDGLAAGVLPEQILAAFGDPFAAARLIRRSKIRQRSRLWHLQHRMFLGLGCLLLFTFFVYLWLLVRFLTAVPTIKRDFIGEIDRNSQAIPEANRAWPLYRQALMKLKEGPIGELLKKDTPLSILKPGSPEWNPVAIYLDQNTDSLQLTFAAAALPDFGFIYRDPANRDFLETMSGKGSYDIQIASTHGLMTGLFLLHVQELRRLFRLLELETIAARDAKNRERWVKATGAMQSMGEQLSSGEFIIIQLISSYYSKTTWRQFRRELAEDSGMLTDRDLQEMAHRVAGYAGGGRLVQRLDTPMFFEDLLQRFYTDDGHGDGRLNPSYFAVNAVNGKSWNTNSRIAGMSLSLGEKLQGAALSGVVASRSELRQVMREIELLEAQEAEKPLWERTVSQPSPLKEFLMKWHSSPWDRLRYAPVLKLFQPLIDAGDDWLASLAASGEYTTLHRDATLVAIALTLYHRRHHEWPTSLEQLTPGLLPAVPLDRFDGNPLKYKLLDGHPLLYSVGQNRLDDGGLPATDPSKGDGAPDGDLRFWPVD